MGQSTFSTGSHENQITEANLESGSRSALSGGRVLQTYSTASFRQILPSVLVPVFLHFLSTIVVGSPGSSSDLRTTLNVNA